MQNLGRMKQLGEIVLLILRKKYVLLMRLKSNTSHPVFQHGRTTSQHTQTE